MLKMQESAFEALTKSVTLAEAMQRVGVALRSDYRTNFVVVAIIAANLLFRAPAFGNAAYDFDEQLYSLIGQRWLDGLLPYAASWDRKPPGLFAIFAISHFIGGSPALAYQIPALLAAIIGSVLIYALSRLFVAPVPAMLAAITYSIGLVLFGSGSAQSEVFFLPLLLGALLLLAKERLSRRRLLAAMLLLGVGLQIKYTVLPFCILLGLYALYRRWNDHRNTNKLLIDTLLSTLAGLLLTITFFIYFGLKGELGSFWQANFLSFFYRDGVGRFPKPVQAPFLVLMLPAIGGLLMAIRSDALLVRRLYLLYCLFAVAALTTVFFPGTVYLYYLATLIPAAMLLSLPLARLPWPFGLPLQAGYLAFLIAIWMSGNPLQRAAADNQALARLTSVIQPHVNADKCLFIYDGPSALYRLTGACIPSRFIYPDHLNNRLERNALGTPQLEELVRVIRSQPSVIVTTPNPVAARGEENDRAVAAALTTNYRLLTSVNLQNREIDVWLLKHVSSKTEL